MWRAWASPTLIYLCLYHLPHVCRTLVPEICVRPEMLCAFRWIDVLTCVIYNCMHSARTSYSCLTLPWRLLTKTGINGFSLLRQWSCSCPATCQHARPAWSSQKRPMSLLYSTAVLWRSYRQMRDTETYYSACVLFVDVELYRLTVLRHNWHCCFAMQLLLQYNQLRLTPSIPWMH